MSVLMRACADVCTYGCGICVYMFVCEYEGEWLCISCVCARAYTCKCKGSKGMEGNYNKIVTSII